MNNPAGELNIGSEPFAAGEVVSVRGEVDLHTSPQLRDNLLQVIGRRPKVLIIDLTGVAYMDSSGVGTMVEAKRLAERNGGAVVLAGLQERVRGVFEITQLDKFFRIVANVEEAKQT